MLRRLSLTMLCAGALAALLSCGTKRQTVRMEPAEQMDRGREYFQAGKYEEAADDFRDVVFNNAGTRIAADASFLLAECHFNRTSYEEAHESYLQFLADYPAAARADEAQIRVAECLLRLSPHHALDQRETGEKALAAITVFFERHPDSQLADRARTVRTAIQEKLAQKDYEAGAFYAKRRQYRSARIYLEGVVADYTETSWASRARALLATLPAAPDSTAAPGGAGK
ncbi:MAG: outer membrane protein assembly factor BamD [Candidatus Edwardsbacteria bacterium]|nr:outer membrane protein assembly factor BamD [Candidatus Edwardsbacteria bacterium]